jgi:hypothetical protein
MKTLLILALVLAAPCAFGESRPARAWNNPEWIGRCEVFMHRGYGTTRYFSCPSEEAFQEAFERFKARYRRIEVLSVRSVAPYEETPLWVRYQVRVAYN